MMKLVDVFWTLACKLMLPLPVPELPYDDPMVRYSVAAAPRASVMVYIPVALRVTLVTLNDARMLPPEIPLKLTHAAGR